MQEKLKLIPAIDRLLAEMYKDPAVAEWPRDLVVTALREAAAQARQRLRAGEDCDISVAALIAAAWARLKQTGGRSLRKVVNATGVVLHTNLGRAPLSARAAAAVREVMEGYCTLEYDLATGQRGTRYAHVVDRLCALTGAEDALVVNNNAAAVLLVLSALAKGREVIVSRGQLVEIGGSFRIPEVMQQGGAILVEVGTTNKTHLADFANAITANTAAVLKVHTSNYRIVGFTAQPDTAKLVKLAHSRGIPVIEDLGSGTLVPLAAGGWSEPTVRESIAAGVDIVTFSGDKLLGAGQAGIIAGRRRYIEIMKKHPLLRALRMDKLSLAALEGTLIDYTVGDPLRDVPVQRMLRLSRNELAEKAAALKERLTPLHAYGWDIDLVEISAQAGGGSLPAVDLAGWGVAVRPQGLSTAALERYLRQWRVPIVARIQDDQVVFDVRCLTDEDAGLICQACLEVAKGAGQ